MMATKPADAKAATPKARTSRSPATKTASKTPGRPAAPKAEAPLVDTAIASAAPDLTVKATADVMKLKTLLDEVVNATGGKKKGVKEIVEATLAALGAALSKGHDLNLPPLGKAKVGRQKSNASNDGEMLVIKLKRGGTKQPGKNSVKKDVTEGLAEAEE